MKPAKLDINQVYVFGSNLSGNHSKTALQFGAKYGYNTGHHGQTYAIPTKSIDNKHSLSLETISFYVSEFIDYAKANQHLEFVVSEFNCNGISPRQLLYIFRNAKQVSNIQLPKHICN